jgi:hypothetical protein
VTRFKPQVGKVKHGQTTRAFYCNYPLLFNFLGLIKTSTYKGIILLVKIWGPLIQDCKKSS